MSTRFEHCRGSGQYLGSGADHDHDTSTTVTDIAGSLDRLSTEVVSFGALAKYLCRVGASSSLTPLGRGKLRPVAGLIRPEGLSVEQGNADHADGDGQLRLAREDAARQAYRCQY